MSPIVADWAASFREVYQQTGMNLPQSLIMFSMEMMRRGWRAARRVR
jgi:hypothetical protein